MSEEGRREERGVRRSENERASTTGGERPSYHGKEHTRRGLPTSRREKRGPSSRTKLQNLSRTTRSNVYPVGVHDVVVVVFTF